MIISYCTKALFIMADGQLFKPEKDYTKDVDKLIPEAEELAKVCAPQNKVILLKLTNVIIDQRSVCNREAVGVRKTHSSGKIGHVALQL